MLRTPEEIGRRMDALGLWPEFGRFTWAVRLNGLAIPYFCTVARGDGKPVVTRFMMLEGWQTLHDFVRTGHDHNFGYYSNPMELPHFELVILRDGTAKVFRHDPGYFPRELNEREGTVCTRILWEAYGLLLRFESERGLPLMFADEKAMFARVEDAAGVWHDQPLPIPPPPPYVERITFEKADFARAKDLPFAAEEVLDVDFRLLPTVATQEARPRCCYLLAAVDSKTGEKVTWNRMSVNAECGLKTLWEMMAPRLLKHLIARGRIPGELRLVSGRVFRMLRPLAEGLSFKLSLHDHLPQLEAVLRLEMETKN
ncbi:MAG: DUF6930 domain-containing protein [Kiritimatiellia bacterium]